MKNMNMYNIIMLMIFLPAFAYGMSEERKLQRQFGQPSATCQQLLNFAHSPHIASSLIARDAYDDCKKTHLAC